MGNSRAEAHARNAASNAVLVRGFTSDQALLTIAQSIYELSKAVEELAKQQP